ncbi:hypothetical protein JTE90_016205 [Oedothorax gibbosus]|uniref:Protein AF-10 n=1 Tax=Oedothorax gibbosus TaxID=931172 RepID=A0AAV6UK93_9ARAC|nr:hypothetical protein JTE90_016205 [Oedothorax gibbosus]
MKEMVGGCCVCSDERGWAENPLVYCDGQGCNVAVHQACYGIVQVPTGPWFCRKCESQERSARVRCELCPSKDGALKRTDGGGWAHVVCALYIPEVRFGNVTTMEPIILQLVPQDRYNKSCYICEEQGKESKASVGACMQCNKSGCKQYFHVTCAQAAGLLCEEAGNYLDNVKYCGYCHYHYQKLKKDSHIKIIPAFKPIPADNATPEPSPEKSEKKPTRSKGDRKGKGNFHTTPNCTATANGESSATATTCDASANNELDFLSDSSSSTISNGSLPNGIDFGTTDSKLSLKKNELHHSNSLVTKFNASNFKKEESSDRQSESPVPATRHKAKKSKDSSSAKDSFKGSPAESKDCQEISAKSAAPTFSSMYENFISKDIDGSQSSKSEKKKNAECTEEQPEKKRSKHSRSKSKSAKCSSEAVISTEKTNPQIPIVRIKRKFNHDRSCSSHSVEEVSVEKSKDYEAVISKTEPDDLDLDMDEMPPKKIEKKLEGEIILHPNPLIGNDAGSLLKEKEIKSEELSFFDLPCTSYQPVPQPVSDHPADIMNKISNQMQEDSAAADGGQLPTSLEELLEKQWAETSNFLRGQAQHFDIASMISCLHDLQKENKHLESQITELVSRRDSLLAINARLKVLPSSEHSIVHSMPYSALSLLQAKPISQVERNAVAGYSGYLYDNGMMHNAQWNNTMYNPHEIQRDYGYHKNPMAGYSHPVATVVSGSMPHTPSPIPISCSPMQKSDMYPHLTAYNHDSSPLRHIASSAASASQSSHLYVHPSVSMSEPMLMSEAASSYNALHCQNGTTDAQDRQSSASVYQTISPPFSNPEAEMPNNASVHPVCNNIVFHQNYEMQNSHNSLEDDR